MDVWHAAEAWHARQAEIPEPRHRQVEARKLRHLQARQFRQLAQFERQLRRLKVQAPFAAAEIGNLWQPIAIRVRALQRAYEIAESVLQPGGFFEESVH